ncbi:hypothetical protein AGMMS50222_08880 [Endomicrobiia bacterium]|nr:hypothetical protein AGMMS49556_05010 [Endomicrobiia bacterium]GHT76395.1 hypothetical protein AGMMS50222_08880 [Endomicrobiia bacterium]
MSHCHINFNKGTQIEIKHNDLPIFIKFENSEGQIKEYILKSTSQGQKLILNRKEY